MNKKTSKVVSKKNGKEEEPQLTFLFVQISGAPDIVIASQACQDIKRNYRDPRIVFIVEKGLKDIAWCLPQVNEVYEFDEYGEHKGFFGMIKFLMTTKIGQIDYAFCASGLDKAMQIAWLLKAQNIYSYAPIDFMTKYVKMAKPLIQKYNNETNFSEDLQKWFNLTIKEEPFSRGTNFTIPDSYSTSVETKLDKVGITKFPIIAICPCSKNPKNNWTPAEVAKLIDLTYPLGQRVLFVGDKQDIWFAKEVQKLTQNPFANLMGKLDLLEIAALAKRTFMFLSVHCEHMHMAYASGGKTICMFFNSKEFYKWAPKEQGNAVVLHRPEGITGEKALEFIQDFSKQQAGED